MTGKIPISASKIPCKDSSNGFTRPASLSDINRIIQDFSLARERCVKAGFDGVEIHGAHGYLITQFLGKKRTPVRMNGVEILLVVQNC